MATAVGQAVDSRLRLPHAVVVEGLAAVGAGTAALVALHIGDSPMRAPDTLSSLRALGVALYVAVGSYTSWRRPGARFGFYLTGGSANPARWLGPWVWETLLPKGMRWDDHMVYWAGPALGSMAGAVVMRALVGGQFRFGGERYLLAEFLYAGEAAEHLRLKSCRVEAIRWKDRREQFAQ